ncbi:MAG: YggS family pyridoxal phosphate-dependent enzyme [Candidatus Eisenbacteria bacterium]
MLRASGIQVNPAASVNPAGPVEAVSADGNRFMSSIVENIKDLNERIEDACARVSRGPKEITVVGVTKTVEPARIQQAVDAGMTVLGENRIQEAASKIDAVRGPVTWHLVGHLQRNKVKKAITMFDMIQSVDSLELALEIDKRSEQVGKVMDTLVEVNTSGEETKYGIAPEKAVDLIGEISHLNNITVRGLMTIGTFTDDEGLIRDCFRTLRELGERVATSGIRRAEMKYLSMGMTSDYELAIEEGSNMIRIGTAIFGARFCQP